MKKLIFFIVITLFISCKKDPLLIIPKKGVSNFKIGEKLDKSLDLEGLEFLLNPVDSLIIHIDVFDNKFYTKKKIRVGTKSSLVKEKMGKPISGPVIKKNQKIKQKKRSETSLRYNHITFFLDTDTKTVKKIRIW
ncbi:hypothetical protein [Ichthyenterobacterium magnum]|uniref:Uncharacterized protein n=1 Tax=Ichthyenterobacterium magnum TaxID=1230530 RepID=A0A420DWK4_9FLAO|nr:hypothetical protein [Ichthyenterobacterium magnum]RKE98561.1 hypothetical protein BXY80_0651 [Ichthyenterobacterium magnum]